MRHFLSIFATILYLSAVGSILLFHHDTAVHASGSVPHESIRRINALDGTFLLGFSEGTVRFAGAPRASPCALWNLSIHASKESGIVEFDLTSMKSAGVCLEDLRRPDPVSGATPALPDTIYVIRLDGEIIFAGPIREEPRLI